MRLIALACVAGLAASAGAEIRSSNYGLNGGGVPPPGNDAVLWDQSGFDPNLTAIVDQEFGDFASFSTYMVDDFTTGGQAWNVTSVSTYMTNGTGLWAGNVTQGKLQVYNKSGSLPNDGSDIAPEYKVNITVSDGGGYLILNADTSGIAELQGINGDYWIGLTPTADFGQFGQEFHLQMAPGFHGDIAAVRNPGGAFGAPNWTGVDFFGFGRSEMAFKLDGDVVPAPGAAALLGLGGLMAARRRRA